MKVTTAEVRVGKANCNESDNQSRKPKIGEFIPVINRNRCEGKAACVSVCPHDVLAIRKFDRAELPGLNLVGLFKTWMHGGLQADFMLPDFCHACGLCVKAYPEKAITLQRKA